MERLKGVPAFARCALLLLFVGVFSAGVVPWREWWLDIIASFTLYWMLPAAAVLLWSARSLRVISLEFLLFCALLLAGGRHLVTLSKFYIPRTEVKGSGSSFSVMLGNIELGVGDLNCIRNLVQRERPDLLALVEYDTAAASRSRIGELFPHKNEILEPLQMGMALYSRHPLSAAPVLGVDDQLPPVLVTSAVISDLGTVHLGILHLLPPLGAFHTEANRVLARRVGTRIKNTTGPAIVAGDFNATPFAPPYGLFTQGLKMDDAQWGFGLFRTWSSRSWWRRLTLDHIFHRGLVVQRYERLPACDSDHYPIIAEFRMS